MSITVELREQGRGMAGALIVLGISFAYTMETWWLAAETSPTHLVAFVVVGLALVIPIVRSVGFRDEDDEITEPGRSPVWIEFLEVVFQSVCIAYGTLLLLGVISIGDPLSVFLRTGLVQVVPLALGAALANELLSEEQEEISESSFPRSLGVFALGALFFSAPIAPTAEVTVTAMRLSWVRIGVILVFTLVVTYLMLYELEFRGQTDRLQGRSWILQIGQTCLVYVVGLVVAAGLLVAVGETGQRLFATWIRRSIVLAFPAAIGASAARVVLA